MKKINIGSNIKIYWKIWRGANKVSEDFNSMNTNLKVFLVGSGDTYCLEPSINNTIDPGYDVIELSIPAFRLDVGVYNIKAIWEKNGGRNVLTSARASVLYLTDSPSEAPIQDEEVRIVSLVESFGRDGMSAYETAVMRGVNEGITSEIEWVKSVSIFNEKVRMENEEVRIANEAERQDNESERNEAEKRRERFKEGLIEKVDEYKPIVINGDVTNAPDEEDITSEGGLLKFKNRPAFNEGYGRGYVILRRNIPIDQQLVNSNTIYEIRDDFNISGKTITLPEGCILRYNGGSFYGSLSEIGTIVCNDTTIEGVDDRNDNIILEGTFKYSVDNRISHVVDPIAGRLDSIEENVDSNRNKINDNLTTINNHEERIDVLEEGENRGHNEVLGTGLGYKVLRKGDSVYDQMRDANMIYEIRHDFDLMETDTGGVLIEKLEIPAGCVLKFNGGSFRNGTIEGKNTLVVSNNPGIFSQTIILEGTWDAELAKSDWFDIKDDCELYEDDRYLYKSGTDNLQGFRNLFKFKNIDIAKGTYFVKGHLDLDVDGQNVNGNDATIKAIYTSRNSALLNVVQRVGLFIRNLHLIGCKYERNDITEWAHGLRVVSSHNITIENVTADYFRGDGVYVGSKDMKEDDTSTNITLKNVLCKYNHRQGLSVVSVSGMVIENCEFSYTDGTAPMNGIDIEPNPIKTSEGAFLYANTCENIRITGCVFKGNTAEDIAIASFYEKKNVSNITIDSCYFESKKGALIIWTGEDIKFTNNYIKTDGNGIVLSNQRDCDRLIVSNTYIESGYGKNGSAFWVIGNDEGGSFTNSVLNNLTIVGFKSYGVRYQGNAKTINNIRYSHLIIKNCFHSFYQSTGTNITYDKIHLVGNGYDVNGNKYSDDFHYDIQKSDDISTRVDLDALNISGSTSSRPADSSALAKNHLLLRSSLVSSEPIAWCKDFNGNICELPPILRRYKGSTADRPSYTYGDINKGCFYYDTEKKRFVVWSGNGWVYPDGSSESNFKSGSIDKLPSAPIEGTIFYSTTHNRYLFYFNGNWRDEDGYVVVNDGVAKFKNKTGDTTSRPAGVNVGFSYYDTTLNKPIWWDGSRWRDSTGSWADDAL